MSKILVYTDASFSEKEKKAGLGVIVQNGSKRSLYSNWTSAKTSNEGELKAIWFACQICLGKEIEIITDSQSALTFLAGEENPDKPRTCEAWENFQRCRFWAAKIKYDCKLAGTKVTFSKVKAHQKSISSESICNNRLADDLAKEGLGKFFKNSSKTLDRGR